MPSFFDTLMLTKQNSVRNGWISCTDGSNYQSICTLKCNFGYEIFGEYSWSKCSADREWWPKLPICKSKRFFCYKTKHLHY